MFPGEVGLMVESNVVPTIRVKIDYKMLRVNDLIWVLEQIRKSAVIEATDNPSLLPESPKIGKRPTIELVIAEAKTGNSIDVVIMFYCWKIAVTSAEFVLKVFNDLRSQSKGKIFRAHRETRRTEVVNDIQIEIGSMVIENGDVIYKEIDKFHLQIKMTTIETSQEKGKT